MHLSVESVFSNNKLHLTYELSGSVKYRIWNGSSWSIERTVSENETGTMPRITTYFDSDDDKVYFLYKTTLDLDTSKWREYDVAAERFGDIKLAVDAPYLFPAGFGVNQSEIKIFYNYLSGPNSGSYISLYYKR